MPLFSRPIVKKNIINRVGEKMRRYYSKKYRIIMKLLLCFLCVFVLVCVYIHYKVKEYTQVICSSNCNKFGQMIINEAIERSMNTCNYSELITIEYSSAGKVSGITADNVHINMITSQLTEHISKRLADDKDSCVKVPAGTFSGISFLGGAGPDVTIDIFQVGSPDVRLVSEFDNSGINQTVYKLYAFVTLELTAVMPTESVDVTVEREVLLAEKVIIGEVPSVVISDFNNK